MEKAKEFAVEALRMLSYGVRNEVLETIREEVYDGNFDDDYDLVIHLLFEKIQTAVETMSQL